MARVLELLRLRRPPSVANSDGYALLHQHETDVQEEGEQQQQGGDDLTRLQPPYTPMYANEYHLRRLEQQERKQKEGPGLLVRTLFVLSIAGFAFLSILGRLLARNTPYIIIEVDSKRANNEQYSSSAYGAAAMYMVLMCYTGFVLGRARCNRRSPLFEGD